MGSVAGPIVHKKMHFMPRNHTFFVQGIKISSLTSKVFIIPYYIISI